MGVQSNLPLNHKNEKKAFDWIWYSFIFLYSSNFYNKSLLLIFLLLAIGVLIARYKDSFFRFNTDFILISFFSISYFIILNTYSDDGFYILMLFLIAPIVCFFIGYIMVHKGEYLISMTIILIALGNFLNGFLNMMLYFKTYGYGSFVRSVPNIWTGVHANGTLQGTFFTAIVSLLFIVMLTFNRRKYKLISFIILVGIIFSLFSTFTLGNRTLLVITMAVLILNTILYVILNRNSFRSIVKMYITIISLALILLMFYQMDAFGIKEFIINSQLVNRTNELTGVEDPRFSVYSKIFNQMLQYPFGGYKMDMGLLYAHNLWLDILHATGLIPFFLFVLFTIKTIFNIFFIIKIKHDSLLFKLLIISFFAAFLLNFMVEPILEGVPFMFLTFCLVSGMISKHYDLIKLKKHSIN